MPVLSEAEGPVLVTSELSATAEGGELPRRIFSPIAHGYDGPALVLSLFQYHRWHRFLLDRVLESVRPDRTQSVRPEPVEGLRILDMATGTGALALDLLARTDAVVIGADITRPMLFEAQRRVDARAARAEALQLLQSSAEAPPFAPESFDAVTFAYLLRYVSDVPATLRALAALLRPGGMMASLDFAVPRGVWYPLWRIYTGAVLPAAGRLYSQHWRDVGSFLGPSIRDFYSRCPEDRLLDAWREAGFPDARARRLSLGGAIATWGSKA